MCIFFYVPDLSARIIGHPDTGGNSIDLEITESGVVKQIGYQLTSGSTD
ncbi:MAG: hypothetical protein ACOCU3_00055 [bacterium]